jgi:hypothetical protein
MRPGRSLFRHAPGAVALAAAFALFGLSISSARADWHGGGGGWHGGVFVGVAPPVYYPPPVYYAPPVYYSPPVYYPPPYAYAVPGY